MIKTSIPTLVNTHFTLVVVSPVYATTFLLINVLDQIMLFESMDYLVKSILTEETAKDGLPLFANAAKLGDAITVQSPKFYKNPKTTAALISFVFRGERSCSDALRTVILACTRQRLKHRPKVEQDDWMQKVGRAITLQNSQFQTEEQSPPDEDQFDFLLKTAQTAEQHFIITPFTAEQEKRIPRADQLAKLLPARLGLVPLTADDPTTRYVFLVPSEPVGREFWSRLVERVEASLEPPSRLKTRMQFLDEGHYLQVWRVPKYVCGFPIVVYDPDSSHPTAFSFSYHPNNVIDVIQWDFAAVARWHQNVFLAFKNGEGKSTDHDQFTSNRVSFASSVNIST